MEKKSAPKAAKKNPAANGSERKPAKKDFLVVGLGASAGGIKALQEFFATMPPNSGMAFVVILHLAPQHESSLPQILQTQTTMPVIQVNETHKVEPNNVYVIPPNHQLEMVDGVIRCTDSQRPHGNRVAIDIFFRTLAEAYERNAVCVVLSGTGSDGTLGLKRVKESSGFAVVQDPDDAEYDQMPRNAIATQLADWILPVHQMPEKLISFRDSSARLHLMNRSDDRQVAKEINADESLREILTLLRIRTGHDFSNYKTPTLVRRIARHLQIHELEDIPSYLKLLREKPEDLQSLLKNLLINVTNFFRDKAAFDALEAEVIPNLFEGKTSADTIRVWSAACASGEEAYSMAMLLSEHAAKQADPPKIQIFATDVDDEAIAEARESRYPDTIEADVSPERLRRFFVKEGSYYRIKKDLREMILFAPHNVLRDPPFSRLDLVSCRNLLIYLNRETQERILQIFHFTINTRGYLFLGSSESAESLTNLYQPVDKKQRIYQRRSALLAQAAALTMPLAGKWQVSIPEAKLRIKREQSNALGDLHYKLVEKIAPPSILVGEDFNIIHLSDSAGRFLRFAGGEPSNNLLKVIHPDLLPDLRAALFAAQREHKKSEFQNLRVKLDDKETIINLVVRAVEEIGRELLLVIFEEVVSGDSANEQENSRMLNKDEAVEAVVRRLEDDLRRTKDHLRSTIEQHEISIEELKASNEELQSVNEELTTVNHDLKEKVEELGQANNDFLNLMASTAIGTLFLDSHLNIKLFTLPALAVFNLIEADIGRPLSDITGKFHNTDINLIAEVESVLAHLQAVEREIETREGKWYLMRISPYRTTQDRIDGVVVTFLEITERRRREEEIDGVISRMERQTRVFNTTLTAISDFAYMFDCDGRFVFSNQPLLDLLNITAEEIVGKNFYDLNYPPELAARLQNQIQQVCDAKTIVRDETPFVSPAGVKGFYEYIFTPVYGEDGAVEFVAGSTRDVTIRKQAEESVRFQAHLLDTVEQSVIATDLAGTVVYWNQFAEKLFGWTAKEAIGRKVTTLTTPKILNEQGEEIMSRLRNGESWAGEFEVQRRDGKTFAAHVINSPIADAEGNLIGMVGVSIDITESKRVEEALRASEVRFRAAFEQANVGIVQLSFDGQFLMVNPGFCKIVGYSEKECLGLTVQAITHPDDYKREQSEIQKLLKGEIDGFSLEKRLLHKQGGTVWGMMTATLVRGESGKPLYVLSIIEDITIRKQTEETLRESEERLRLIMESVSEYAIITTDPESIITEWNAGAEKIFGFTEKEAVGQSGAIIFTPEDRRANVPEKEMKTALKKGRAEDERWHIRKDGSRFYASGIMSPLLRDGEVEGFVKVARDMTEKIAADKAIGEIEIALREKQTLQRLVAGQEDERRRIARDLHDHLGQQMTSLRMKIAVIKNLCDGDETLSAEIGEVDKIAAHLDADVDFLAWELRPAALDDLGLPTTLANFVREWSHHTNVKAEFHIAGIGKSRLAFEVETNLYRIAQEALNNIYKHARAKMVSVLLEKRKNTIVLIVEDNGIGFNPEDKLTRKKGLGLIGMDERAALLGGTLEIEAEKDKGTTIFARVPLAIAAEKE